VGRTETYSCKLEDFGSEVLQHSGHIHGRLGADTHLVLCVLLQETLDTAAGELWEIRVSAIVTRRGCCSVCSAGNGSDAES